MDVRHVNIYTCTSFSGMKEQNGVVAYILEMIVKNESVTLQDSLKIQNATPNGAELRVVIESLKRMREKCELVIYTESPYVAAGYSNGWVDSWKNNNWRTAKGKDVSNKELWIELDSLLSGHNFTIVAEKDHEYRKWLKTEVNNKAKETK